MDPSECRADGVWAYHAGSRRHSSFSLDAAGAAPSGTETCFRDADAGCLHDGTSHSLKMRQLIYGWTHCFHTPLLVSWSAACFHWERQKFPNGNCRIAQFVTGTAPTKTTTSTTYRAATQKTTQQLNARDSSPKFDLLQNSAWPSSLALSFIRLRILGASTRNMKFMSRRGLTMYLHLHNTRWNAHPALAHFANLKMSRWKEGVTNISLSSMLTFW